MTENQLFSSDPLWRELKSGQLLDCPVHLFEQTESTNTLAMEMARSGAPSGTLVIAETQSRGRGRLGKSWLSPPGGGLYFSLLLRPHLKFNEIPRLSLAVGVAVCRAIRRNYRIGPRLKWPNDIFLDNRKCGGILAEAEFTGEKVLVIIGIGLNVSTPLSVFPAKLRQRTTSLQHHVGRPIVRVELLASLLREIDLVVSELEKGKFPEILAEWRQLDATRGKILTWVAISGEVVEGISLGPDDEGRLHIRDNKGREHEILSGDVQLAERQRFGAISPNL